MFRKKPLPKGRKRKRQTYTPFIDSIPKVATQHPPARIPAYIHKYIRERDNGECQGCGRHGTQVHHISFRKMGGGHGQHVPENLVLLCYLCHQGKDGPHQRHDMRLYWEAWAARKYGLTHAQWYLISIGKAESAPWMATGRAQRGEGQDVSHGDCP